MLHLNQGLIEKEISLLAIHITWILDEKSRKKEEEEAVKKITVERDIYSTILKFKTLKGR